VTADCPLCYGPYAAVALIRIWPSSGRGSRPSWPHPQALLKPWLHITLDVEDVCYEIRDQSPICKNFDGIAMLLKRVLGKDGSSEIFIGSLERKCVVRCLSADDGLAVQHYSHFKRRDQHKT
jgi:hypothetical protein